MNLMAPRDSLSHAPSPEARNHLLTSADVAGASSRASVEVEEKLAWLAMWEQDWEQVATTGKHLDTVMWSDDRAVGMRGWYY